jgi:hypothetical protein
VPSPLAWRRPIDDWLAQAVIDVSRAVSIQWAVIGCDVVWHPGGSPKLEGDRPEGVVLPDGTYLPATY